MFLLYKFQEHKEKKQTNKLVDPRVLVNHDRKMRGILISDKCKYLNYLNNQHSFI